MHRSWSKAAVAVGLGVLASLPARPAAAQLDATQPPFVDRTPEGDIDDHVDWINHKDCVNDALFEFRLVETGTVDLSSTLHVWAASSGAACDDPDARDGPSCKQVYEGDAYALGQAVIAEVKVRDILRPETGPLTPGTETPETVCDQDIDDKTDVILQFFLLDSGGNVLSGVPTYQVSYDLVGPEPPTSVKAGVGENALVVSWNANDTDEFLGTYNVYAEAVSGSADGGVDTDGGIGAGGASSGGCSSDALTAGEIPTVNPRAETNASTETAEADGLTNGVTYAVGVASVDNFKNPGPLSSLSCGTPEPVTGFFEAYREAGGGAGGGFCSLGAAPSRLAAAFVALAALGFAARRRRGRADARRTP